MDNEFKIAIQNNNISKLDSLLSEINNFNYIKQRVLFTAVMYGSLDVVKHIIEKGANIHEFDGDLLNQAAIGGHLETTRFLITKGININLQGSNALVFACEKGHFEIVKLLIDNKIKLNSKKELCLQLTMKSYNSDNHFNVIKILIESGDNLQYGKASAFLKSATFKNEKLFLYLMDECNQSKDIILNNDDVPQDVKKWVIEKTVMALKNNLEIKMNKDNKIKDNRIKI